METQSAHYVRVRYSGPTERRSSRYVVSWEGWPASGPNTVRRFIEWTSDHAAMAEAVATMFCEWLSDMPGDYGTPLRYAPKAVTYGSVNSNEWAVLINTEEAPE